MPRGIGSGDDLVREPLNVFADSVAAEFLDITKPRPVLLFEFVKGWLTGADPKFGEMHAIDDAHRPRS